MANFKFTHEDDGVTTTKEFEEFVWTHVHEEFLDFLRGCGYIISHSMELIDTKEEQ